MALIDIHRVVETVTSFLVKEKVVFDTIVDQYFDGEQITFFKGQRRSIPSSSLPSIEVYPQSATPGWYATRTQQNDMGLGIDITTDNGHPDTAVDLESRLVTLATRILAHPPHLRAPILGTQTTLQDSLPNGVQYGTAQGGRMRVAVITWQGKHLDFLADKLFAPVMAAPGPLQCG